MSDFGTRLKQARKGNHVTQAELAKALGVAQSTIANYENNTRFPGMETLREISQYLDISLDHLMNIEEKPRYSTSDNYEEPDYENIANSFIELLLEYKEEKAKELIKEISLKGVPLTKIISRIFVPVLENVGRGWQEGAITVAQEHYITAIIDRLNDFLSESQEIVGSKKLSAVFMAPGGEEHVLTLKMALEFFKAFGWKTRFIGSSVPLDGLLRIIKEEKASVMVMSALTNDGVNSAGYLISALKASLGKKAPVLILGGKFEDSDIVISQTNTDILLSSLDSLYNEILNIEEMIKHRE